MSFRLKKQKLDAVIATAIFIAATFAGCGPLRQTGWKTQRQQGEPLVYKIQYPGQTISHIAGWYTGKQSNWSKILSHNPRLEPRKLRVGDTVIIPAELVVRRDPFPKRHMHTARQISRVGDPGYGNTSSLPSASASVTRSQKRGSKDPTGMFAPPPAKPTEPMKESELVESVSRTSQPAVAEKVPDGVVIPATGSAVATSSSAPPPEVKPAEPEPANVGPSKAEPVQAEQAEVKPAAAVQLDPEQEKRAKLGNELEELAAQPTTPPAGDVQTFSSAQTAMPIGATKPVGADKPVTAKPACEAIGCVLEQAPVMEQSATAPTE